MEAFTARVSAQKNQYLFVKIIYNVYCDVCTANQLWNNKDRLRKMHTEAIRWRIIATTRSTLDVVRHFA